MSHQRSRGQYDCKAKDISQLGGNVHADEHRVSLQQIAVKQTSPVFALRQLASLNSYVAILYIAINRRPSTLLIPMQRSRSTSETIGDDTLQKLYDNVLKGYELTPPQDIRNGRPGNPSHSSAVNLSSPPEFLTLPQQNSCAFIP